MTHHPIPTDSSSDATASDASARPSRRSARWAPPAAIAVGAVFGAVGALVLIAVTAGRVEQPGPEVVGSKQPPPPARVEPTHSSAPPRAASSSMRDQVDHPTGESGTSAVTSGPTVTDRPPGRRPAYLIIQDEIDRALAEREQDRAGG